MPPQLGQQGAEGVEVEFRLMADPVDLLGLVTIYMTRTLSITPNVVVGLTDGSPNWGVGIELSWKFWRW